MRVFACNTGSSSLKLQLIEFRAQAETIARGVVTEFGPHALYDWTYANERLRDTRPAADHDTAAREVLTMLARGTCG
jgi:acetate kinase